MKYIKSYEKINGGVDLDDPHLIQSNDKLPSKCKFKIGDTVRLKHQNEWFYKLEYYYTKEERLQCFITINTFSRMWVYEDVIELVPEEELAANKYNL